MISPIRDEWRRAYIGAVRTKGKEEITVPDAGDLGVVAIVIAIIGTIYSVYTAITAPKPNFGNDLASPKYGTKYGFDAISNTISNELIYPIPFGRNKYGGNIIWNKKDGDNIHMFLLLGIGKINSISEVKVNDIPIEELPGCSYAAYLGIPDQTVDSRAGGEVKGLRNIAYLALTLVPSEKLPGGDPTVTCVYEGLLMKTWSGAVWTGETYSRNPAACLRKLLIIPREDGGAGVDESELDDASFGECYDRCKILLDDGDGGLSERHLFDFVFDAERPIHDAIMEILQPYGMYLVVGEKISLKMLKPDDPVYDFDMDNIKEGSFKYYYASKNDSLNDVTVKYGDPEQNDVAIDAKSVDLYDQIKTGAVRKGEYMFLGLSRFAEASRRAEFIKNETNINIIFAEFDMDIDALHCAVGDVVTLSHDLTGWNRKPFRIIKITEESDFTRHAALKEENSSIYNDAFGSVIASLDYGSPPNPYRPVSDVTGINIEESAYYLHKDGTVGTDIAISWLAPSDASKQFLKYYQVELKKGSAAYKTAGFTAGNNFTIYSVEAEITYNVRIKTVSINDVLSDGFVSDPLTVLGKLAAPSNVLNFETYQEGNLLKFSWSAIPDADLARYVIKKGSEWGVGMTIAELIDTTEFMYPVGETGVVTFMIKAVDTSGNESAIPGIDTITIVPPPEMNFINTFDPWSVNHEYKLSNIALVKRNDYDSGYVRNVFGLMTQNLWEDREAEGKTWEQQEADLGLILDEPVRASGYYEMVTPIDLETIFEFKIFTDVLYGNISGGNLAIQIAVSEDGVNFSAFTDINANATYRARYVKFKFTLSTANANNNVYFYACSIFINAPSVRVAWAKDVAIPLVGKTMLFGAGFSFPPRVNTAIINGVKGIIIISNKTKDQMDARVYDLTGSAIGTAEIDWEAKGY